MKQVTAYEADDGTLFKTEDEAKNHDQTTSLLRGIIEVADAIFAYAPYHAGDADGDFIGIISKDEMANALTQALTYVETRHSLLDLLGFYKS